MNYVPLARCDECLNNGQCVRLKTGFLCRKCASRVVVTFLSERKYKKHRRENAGSAGRSPV